MNTRTLLRLTLAACAFTALLITVSAQRQTKKPTATKPVPTGQPTRNSRPTFTNSIGIQFVQIPAGTFWMGSDASNCPRDDPFTERNENQDCVNKVTGDEKPRHQVTISRSFWLGKYEVTQAEWYKVMGNNPSDFKSEKVGGDSRNHPVEKVSWDDAQSFIRRLNGMEDASSYRLPTEAEWEYSCRAGSTGDYAGDLNAMAWYVNNADNTTHPVGQKLPNAWGLYDMHGNVWEWVQDWYGESYYSQSSTTDPRGPSSGSGRVIRGGDWFLPAVACRSAIRGSGLPESRRAVLSFRLLRTPK